MYIYTENVINIVNLMFIIVSIILTVAVLSVCLMMKNHSLRMTWFITALCIVLGGLSAQISAENVGQGIEATYILISRVFYSMVAPFFSLYFIETERAEGQEWDGYFWTIVQSLVAVLVICFSAFGGRDFYVYMTIVVQYIVVIIMLLISSKDIEECIDFIIGSLFCIVMALIGMSGLELNLTGFGATMLLLIVFFGYQIEMEEELLKKQNELTQNKMSLLMEQMHPHFIYNSLQQIALLCDENPESVKPAIYSFSGYLRKNFEALTNERMVPFMEEMEHVDMFVELAQILPSREFEVVKDFEITDFELPALVLQPLVENAIKYGIGMSTEGDKVVIKTRVEKGYIVITVSDDGHGKSTELSTQKKRKSVGTQNARTRLKILCNGELTINKTDKGTDAVIRFPKPLPETK